MPRNGSYPISVQPGIPKLPATPDGWERTPLKKYLVEVKRPAALKDDREYQLVTVKRNRGGAESRGCLTGRKIKTKTQFYVEAGDFLISRRQIVHGACAIVPGVLDGAIVSNEYAVLRNHEGLELNYLKYLAESVYFQQTCFHSSLGVHVEKLIFKLDQWLNWSFNLPPLSVQKQIVEVLGTWDLSISLTSDLISEKERYFAYMLNATISQNKTIPRRKLSELGTVLKGKGVTKDQLIELGVPCLRYGEIYTDHHFLVREFLSFVSEEVAEKEATPLQYGDIIFAASGETSDEIAKCCAFIGQETAVVGGDTLILRCHSLDPVYLGFALNTYDANKQKWRLGQGQSIVHIHAQELRSIEVPVPDNKVQRDIGNFLAEQRLEIENLKRYRKALQRQKAGLAKRLLTGEWSVNREVRDG